METVKHLWNINQFMTKLRSPLIAELQMCYMKKCRNLSKIVELPKENFGPTVMCSYCNSLWSTTNHQVRISRGRKMSKSVKKIVQRMNEMDEETPKVRASLAKKAIKNEKNKLVIKCSLCSNKTELPFTKRPRPKPPKVNDSEVTVEQSNSKKKKKKKKSKDKSAGLNISICSTPERVDKGSDVKTSTKIIAAKRNKILSTTIAKKSKKLNVQRLKRIVERNTTTAKKKNNLQSFLAELQ